MNDPLCAKERFCMPEADKVFTVVREWIQKAESDFKAASHTLKMGKESPTDIVCFHAEQCAEKYLKSFLVLRGIDFPKTHDIRKIVALLPWGTPVPLTLEEQRKLTGYATVARYPGGYEPITLSEARGAVKIARRIRAAIRKLLPKETLGRTRH